VGLTIVYEDEVREDLARGELVPVLEEFCQPFPGYYLYYPHRRHASPALRALIDHVHRTRRRPARGPKPATRAHGDAQVDLSGVPGAAKRR
jgi:DNA-binding transcriptional LysR family regulator